MLNELAKEAHQIAVEHGWWEEPPKFEATIALCHSELSEAFEEYRAGRPDVWHACAAGGHCQGAENCPVFSHVENVEDCPAYDKKPEGKAVEMADCLIRILDWFGFKMATEGLDPQAIVLEKMAYNKTRPYRHGGKLL